MAVGDVYKLRLESIVPLGDALGRFDGKPVFVEGGAPDETVCCRVTEERKTWARAELLEIIEPSPARIDSTCAFYGKCGGCNLQHIDYNAQLAAKTAILKDSFLRIGGCQPPQPEIFPSPPWEYRNRMLFHCLREKSKLKHSSQQKQAAKLKQAAKNEGDLKFGLMGKQSGEIIAVSDCPVAAAPIREILCQSGKGITLPPEKDRFTVFSIDDVLLNEGGRQKGKIKILDKEIFIDAGLFFQSNCFMLEKLAQELRKIAALSSRNLPMADLYCGVGTFALFLGNMFPKIILAEENKNAVSLARENLKSAVASEAGGAVKTSGAEFFALRDNEWPRTLLRSKDAFGFAVVDPPRAGLSPKLAAALAQDGPPLMAYVYCDAASLARDSKILATGGYKLNELKLFDFYPQTAHIETLAVFER